MVELTTFLEPAWSIRERQREFRGWLGVGSQNLKDRLRAAFPLRERRGAQLAPPTTLLARGCGRPSRSLLGWLLTPATA